ncbi:hypothetical protein OQH61_04680 [Helicobacter sp. MIT 21-1697]|uniref:hypothetical protein n=1 Tax=Helicobacter sp. MIT 21-1697 TaxID=2993733 RepID=UPI00224B0BC5|nr:hypothetical protein [Helicobacter sp. MIT 21-1697]MCX2717027.1 hypothetical protein [Helicobacter sp. MIT 21-1697]
MKGFLTFFKYEFVSSAKPLSFAYGMGMFASLLLWATNHDFISMPLRDMCETLLFVLMASGYAAFCVLLIVRVFQTFWVEIFGDRGYLTLTLPISLDVILFSKILNLLFWACAAAILSQFIEIIDNPQAFLHFGLRHYLEYLYFLKFPILVLYYITLILFVTALLNALRIRTLVLLKGFGLVIIIQLIHTFISTMFFPYFVLMDFCMDLLGIIVFYSCARYLIMYKLELE